MLDFEVQMKYMVLMISDENVHEIGYPKDETWSESWLSYWQVRWKTWRGEVNRHPAYMALSVKRLQGVPEEELRFAYSAAAVFVYPSLYEGFGMPPLEAAACGTSLILGPFYEQRMRHVFGNLVTYVNTTRQMFHAIMKVDKGLAIKGEPLVNAVRRYGTDLKHGWNEVAADYLNGLLHGPFRQVDSYVI